MHQQATPSVYFNFDQSNQKTNDNVFDNSYVPYDYSFSTNKHDSSKREEVSEVKKQLKQQQFTTPVSYVRNSGMCNNLLNNAIIEQNLQNSKNIQKSKLNTQQFFEQFDKNFVINFGQSPNKNENIAQFRRTFQSYPGVSRICLNSKIDSYISEPIARRLSIQPSQPQNQQDIVAEPIKFNTVTQRKQQTANIQKQNILPKQNSQKLKLTCQIRKRVLFKNNQRVISHVNKRKNQNVNKIINHDNLLIVTSSNWTDLPKNKKMEPSICTQPLKIEQKRLKKVQSNIFTARQIFKQTLKSTTLDNWKKKFINVKNQFDYKHRSKNNNIFQRPFSLIR